MVGERGLSRRSVDYVIHGDPHVAFVIDAFSVADEQYLGGFVLYEERFDDLVGDGPVADEVKVVEINGFRLTRSFQAAFYEGAGGATGTVFEDELGADG